MGGPPRVARGFFRDTRGAWPGGWGGHQDPDRPCAFSGLAAPVSFDLCFVRGGRGGVSRLPCNYLFEWGGVFMPLLPVNVLTFPLRTRTGAALCGGSWERVRLTGGVFSPGNLERFTHQ